jgi:hypothetical protein
MIDFGEEADLGCNHGILLWEEKFKFEYTAYNKSTRPCPKES